MSGWGGRWSVDHRVGRRGLWVALLLLALFVLWTTTTRHSISEGSRDSVWIKRPFGAWPSTVVDVAGTGDIQFSLFATYRDTPSNSNVDDSAPAMVGRPTLGSTIDSDDSNNINGSRYITGITAGPVKSLSIFVATPVDRAPNDQFEMAIYDDKLGAPHRLLAVSDRSSLRADEWNTVAIDAILEPNSAYWFVYNTNGTTVAANNPVYSSMPAAPLDELIRNIQRSGSLETARWIELLGSQFLTTVVLAVLAAVIARRRWSSALAVLAGFGVSLLIAMVLRSTVFAPFGAYPSGHALRAGYVVIVLAALVRRRSVDIVGALLLAFLCVTTIYTRGHYAEESIGGLLLAGTAAATAFALAPLPDRPRRLLLNDDSPDEPQG